MTTWDARNFLVRATLRRDKVTSFADFPFSIPAIGGLDTLEFDRPVTFFVGENGAGKSTLLEAIAIGIGPQPGGRQPQLQVRDPRIALAASATSCASAAACAAIRDSFFLRAESYFNVATEIEALDREPGSAGASSMPMAANPCTSSRTANRSSRCS